MAVAGRSSIARLAPVLFVTGALSQYIGAGIAVGLFDELSPQSVAWLRICGAAVVLMLWRRPWRRAWTRSTLQWTAVFGVVTALMNTSFYLAIERVPLGTAVAIEFVGPIAVAARTMRSRRGITSMVCTGVGVALMCGVQLTTDALGLAYVLTAAACWAGYIVLGARVSNETAGIDGLAVGLVFGAVGVAPIGLWGSSAAFDHPHLLALCVVVGLMSTATPYGIDQIVLRHVDRGHFALLLALLPTTATVVGAIQLHQQLRGLEYLGIALVVVALLLRGNGDAGLESTNGLGDHVNVNIAEGHA